MRCHRLARQSNRDSCDKLVVAFSKQAERFGLPRVRSSRTDAFVYEGEKLVLPSKQVSVVDLRSFRIPDILSLPLIAAGITLAILVPGVNAVDHLAGALAAYLLFAAVGEIYFRSRGIDGLGLGDAKLFAGAGAWLGWQNLPIVLLVAATGGLIHALLRPKAEDPDRL